MIFSPIKPLGKREAIRVYLVEADELIGDIADGIAYIDPGLVTFVEVDISEAVRTH